MCGKCQQIDAEIERYQRLCRGINDPPTVDYLNTSIDNLQAEKAALHPGPDDSETVGRLSGADF